MIDGMVWLLSMVGVPYDPPNYPAGKGEDPAFFTYTGPDSQPFERREHPRHTQAFEDISTFAERVFPELAPPKERSVVVDGKHESPTMAWVHRRWLPFSNSMGSARRIDANGNTLLNRLLMSHFIIDEWAAGRIYQALLNRRMTSNRANKFGQTPLMLAVESGWPSLVEAVLRSKPNLKARDRDGRDAIDYLQFASLRNDGWMLTPSWVLTTERIGDLLADSLGAGDRERIRRYQVRVRAYAVANQWLPDEGGIVP